jgi:hypothetical protein
MIPNKKEFFNDYNYFLLEKEGEDYYITYKPYSLLTESDKSKKKKVDSKDVSKLISKLKKFLSKNKKATKKDLEEFVDADGTMLSSKIPFLNQYLTPKKTMDQTVVAARISNDPVTRGYRVYYGESEEVEDVINEVDYSEAFGFEETKDARTYLEAAKIMKEMGIEDPIELDERLKKLGFSRNLDKSLKKEKKKGKCLKCFTKRRLSEKEEIAEMKKMMATKIIEDMLTKSGRDSEILEKDSEENEVEKLLKKNLISIKKIADKEGINVTKLLNYLKKGE